MSSKERKKRIADLLSRAMDFAKSGEHDKAITQLSIACGYQQDMIDELERRLDANQDYQVEQNDL